MIEAQAPGKLYIAGEYAVVEKGYPSIIAAINRFAKVKVQKATSYGSIFSPQYKEESLKWKREGNEIVFDNRDNPFHYIISGIHLVEEYAHSLNIKLKLYHLSVNSNLDSWNGTKYGLGSSAAVTVATIKALCKFYNIPLTQMQLFKLASIAHLEVQGNGSLGDIAASVFGGWIAYTSFDRDWLLYMRTQMSLVDLINTSWPSLKIESLTPPNNLKLLIGWTGSPASTSNLLDKVTINTSNKIKAHQSFLHNSKKCINKMITGFYTNDLALIQQQINYNRHLLRNLSNITNVNIETPELKQLCNIANKYNGAAKTSGAGGGDCGIVIVKKDTNINELVKDWENNNIKRLKLNIQYNPSGVTNEKR